MSQVLVQARVPEQDADVLREVSEREDRPIASIIRLLVREYAEQQRNGDGK